MILFSLSPNTFSSIKKNASTCMLKIVYPIVGMDNIIWATTFFGSSTISYFRRLPQGSVSDMLYFYYTLIVYLQVVKCKFILFTENITWLNELISLYFTFYIIFLENLHSHQFFSWQNWRFSTGSNILKEYLRDLSSDISGCYYTY